MLTKDKELYSVKVIMNAARKQMPSMQPSTTTFSSTYSSIEGIPPPIALTTNFVDINVPPPPLVPADIHRLTSQLEANSQEKPVPSITEEEQDNKTATHDEDGAVFEKSRSL